MDAVGADDHIGGNPRLLAGTTDEREFDFVPDLRHADAALVQAKHVLRQRLSEHGSQVGAMGHIAMTAVEALALLSHRLDEKHGAVLPAPKLPGRFQTNGEP